MCMQNEHQNQNSNQSHTRSSVIYNLTLFKVTVKHSFPSYIESKKKKIQEILE